VGTLDQIKFIKEKANIADVIGYFVELKRDGKEFKGLSPFSNERSPSFMVCPSKRIFKDFSSGKSGDVIDFVREHKGYSYREAIKWILDFYNLENPTNEWQYNPPIEMPVSYIEPLVFHKTLNTGHKNYFLDFLRKTFDAVTAFGCAETYHIGTSKRWEGASIFWLVDTLGRIRSGKIMVYNPVTGKRVKHPQPLITWVHRAAKMKDFNLSSCLFGEHLLVSNPNKIVRLVESEKTAIVASIIYPEFLWLATGSLTNLSVRMCQVLAGRIVMLIPDCGAESQWNDKRLELSRLIKADFILDPIPGEHEKGYDLCDYILENLI